MDKNKDAAGHTGGESALQEKCSVALLQLLRNHKEMSPFSRPLLFVASTVYVQKCSRTHLRSIGFCRYECTYSVFKQGGTVWIVLRFFG